MNSPSARAKLGRALEHLGALDALVKAYRASKPYEVIQDFDVETREHLVYATPTAQPPIAVALTAGDCFHNARSALDHAVYARWEEALDRPLTPAEQRPTYFPIVSEPEKWPDALSGPLRYFPGSTQSALARIQPFQIPNPDQRWLDQLGLLNELDNQDKHRVLPVVSGVTQVLGVGVSSRAEGRHRFTGPRVSGGSIVSRVPEDLDPTSDATPMWEIHVNLSLPGPHGLIEDIERTARGLLGRVEYALALLSRAAPDDRAVIDA